MSELQWWSLVAVGLGAIVCMVWKALVIERTLRESSASKPATPPLAKKDDEPLNHPVVCTASQPEQPKEAGAVKPGSPMSVDEQLMGLVFQGALLGRRSGDCELERVRQELAKEREEHAETRKKLASAEEALRGMEDVLLRTEDELRKLKYPTA